MSKLDYMAITMEHILSLLNHQRKMWDSRNQGQMLLVNKKIGTLQVKLERM